MTYNNWDKESLLAFSSEIEEIYKQGKIKAPCHFPNGSEEGLIKIFNDLTILKTDYIFSNWRSWYHWLLSGRDKEELKRQILAGHSMHVNSHRFFTSSIVGGIAPIAMGVAYALKEKQSNDRVFCFLGCMGVSTGIAQESIRYSSGHDLPITFIIEDNNKSVCSDTMQTWGINKINKVVAYKYIRVKNHAGPFADGEKKYVMF